MCNIFPGYIQYLCETYPDLLDEALDESNEYLKHFISRLKVSTQPIELSHQDTAELLFGKTDLSQRGYKQLRSILLKNNVIIPSYDSIRDFCNKLDVGSIDFIHETDSNECACMGVNTTLLGTLQNIVSTEKLFSKFQFPTQEQQDKIINFLLSKNENLYQNLSSSQRTLFLRVTGDNFRAAAKFPTEQTSYSILNMPELSNNPYGQFVSTLWRGSEDRKMLSVHCNAHFSELSYAVRHGVKLVVDGNVETFNVIVFMVADLSFLKDILGHCSSVSMYGCFYCKLRSSLWVSKKFQTGPSKTLTQMVIDGEKGFQKFGDNPKKDSPEYTKFQQSHFGQWVCIYIRIFLFLVITVVYNYVQENTFFDKIYTLPKRELIFTGANFYANFVVNKF